MTLRDFALLTDDHIHYAVVAFLRIEGFDVLAANVQVEPPFVIVAERAGDDVKVRVRQA